MALSNPELISLWIDKSSARRLHNLQSELGSKRRLNQISATHREMVSKAAPNVEMLDLSVCIYVNI